jgi:sn-glycerol 3-phosphate transport system ATP-binding protein
MIEMLGAERLVYGRVGSLPVTVRVDSTDTAPKLGDRVMLAIAPEHVHWFDPGTQQRLAI